jgi:hypothetical protein
MNPCGGGLGGGGGGGGGSGGGGLLAFNAEVTRQGAMIAYDSIFAWMCLGVLLLLPLLILMRPPAQAPALKMEEMAAE